MGDKLVVGNWKMYKTVEEAVEFVQGLVQADLKNREVYLAVPFTAIEKSASAAKGSKIVIGGQNMNDAEEGAYTGEIAALMLKEAGARFVLLGHSERRKYFNETDAFINKKVLRALADGLLPLVCIGETLEDREKGKTHEILTHQLQTCLKNIDQEKGGPVNIAYEPIWAIGSGNTPSPEIVNEIQGTIRKITLEILGHKLGEQTRILYGGSVNSDNVSPFTQQPEVDGVLVGGASLSLESFIRIVQNSQQDIKSGE